MSFNVRAVTKGPRHHFFGFHDLVQWNAKGDLMLGLEVDDISRPPYPGDTARSGIIIPDTQEFIPIHDTQAFNYPQGARQQWMGESDTFLCNDRVGDGWGCRVVDARARKVMGSLTFPVYCHNSATGDAFYISYSRLRLVGGYGYAGIADPYADEDIPSRCGIYRGNIRTGKHELLVSLRDIAACGESKPKETGFPHYVTHPALNPSGTRLSFLHRYRVEDGGEITRLMTVGVDGSGLRVLAKGFLSHFDWLDDEAIMIWGADTSASAALRESPLLGLPWIRQGFGLAKSIYRLLRAQRQRTGRKQSMSFLRITDTEPAVITVQDVGILTEDGHPMVCPANRTWLVNDTYPDAEGVRTLMLYDHKENRRIDLGRFRMLNDKPNPQQIALVRAFEGIASRICEKFPQEQHLFTRSGLHCDLHPRWRPDGTAVAFDSIHEGTRQIYAVKVKMDEL